MSRVNFRHEFSVRMATNLMDSLQTGQTRYLWDKGKGFQFRSLTSWLAVLA